MESVSFAVSDWRLNEPEPLNQPFDTGQQNRNRVVGTLTVFCVATRNDFLTFLFLLLLKSFCMLQNKSTFLLMLLLLWGIGERVVKSND